MDAAKEREYRELAARLIGSKRHKRIGLVLGDLLAEIDLLRDDGEQPRLSMAEATAMMQRMLDEGTLATATRRVSTDDWRRAVEAKASAYPSKPPSLKGSL